MRRACSNSSCALSAEWMPLRQWNRRAPSPAFVRMQDVLHDILNNYECGPTIDEMCLSALHLAAIETKALAAEETTTHPNPKP